jgi:carbon-monoxide dehydrogenase large subunit
VIQSFGRSVRRAEDGELLTGRARFVDDLEAPGVLHLAVVRSPFAHALIVSPPELPDSNRARLFWTATDVSHLSWPQLIDGLPPRTALASGRVRHVGEPVAMVVAGDRVSAEDLAEGVAVDYEPLDAAVTMEDALRPDAPLVYNEAGSNVVFEDVSRPDPDLFVGADVVIRRTFRNQRVAPAMMEGRGILASPEGDGLRVYVGHQNPHRLRDELAERLRVPVRVSVPEVGGAFGAKVSLYPEYLLAAAAALELGRPVKFVESRRENLLIAQHGRAQVQRVELGATAQGRLVALRVNIDGDFGAAVGSQYYCLQLTRRMLSGAYVIPSIAWTIRGVLTHTAPTGAYRGAGRPEAAYLIERAMDELARELDVDPVELRLANFVDPDAFPHPTPTGAVYDSGDYATALSEAVARAGYDDVRASQTRGDPTSTSRYLGVGVASYVEWSAAGEEYAEASVDKSGTVTVRVGTAPTGQGHRTAWAQLAADHFGLDPGEIRVVVADTGEVASGGGTMGSRSAQLGGSAVSVVSEAVAGLLKELAAARLEAAPEDIQLAGGRAHVVGTDVGVPLGELAAEAGGEVRSSEVFSAAGQTFPFGTHVCVVEVDEDTGTVDILRMVTVDDCGRVINPMLVEGQIHGGTLQGLAQARFEEVRFDELGGLLTGTFASYSIPSIGQAPIPESFRTETPSPNNPNGVKGVGELGATGATPALANAVYDALAPLGIAEDDLPMPFTPDRVWEAIRRARQ